MKFVLLLPVNILQIKQFISCGYGSGLSDRF